MRIFSDKIYRDNQNKHFTFNNFFFENHAVYETMWKNTVEPDRTQLKIWYMRVEYWITKATNTHSGYVILIFHCNSVYRKSLLHYTYITCLVEVYFKTLLSKDDSLIIH